MHTVAERMAKIQNESFYFLHKDKHILQDWIYTWQGS